MISEERLEKALDDIETLEKELKEIKEAHSRNKSDLLELVRIVATIKISTDANSIVTVLDNQLPDNDELRTQLFVDAGSYKVQALNSDHPIKRATEFREKWTNTLRGLGFDMVLF